MGAPPYDIDDLRARLAGGSGPTLWRSFDAVADTPAFRNFLAAEFPAAARLADGPDRRQFIRLMAASFAMAGLGACGQTDDRANEVPYVRNHERIEPGESLSYASASLLDGIANGILVTTRNGRPLKVEGNPDHPWSRGGTDVFAQAGILDLYDPTRSQAVRFLNRISTWDAFRTAMAGAFGGARAGQGGGVRLLTGPVTSPTLLAAIDRMRQAYPGLVWHVAAPVSREPLYAASQAVFGQRLETRWAFDKARVVVAIGGDFLDGGPHQIGVARDWADARKALAAKGHLLELHAAASTPTLTSAKADHHVAVEPGDMLALVHALGDGSAAQGSAPDPRTAWLRRASAALRGARGASVVLAGADQPVEVQAAVHRLNVALGNVGTTVSFAPALLPEAPGLAPLVEAMGQGQVTILLTIGANPVYAAPGALGFTEALAKVPLKIQAGQFVDETAAHADWHVPLAHTLESWGDARALDGTVTLHQPTIAPLYNGRSAIELLSLLVDAQPKDGLSLLRAQWQDGRDATAFEPWWRQAVIDGFLQGSALPAVPVTAAPAPAAAPPAPAADGLTVLFRPDPCLWDGAFSNNAWLQELPKPLTKIVWDAPIAISPTLAEREKLAQGDVVTLTLDARSVSGPVWIMPGQAARTVTLFLGFGRSVPDMVSSGLGYDANLMRRSEGSATEDGLVLTRLDGQRSRLVTTQDHSTMEGHDFVRLMPVGVPAPVRSRATPRSLYPPKPGDERAWGMVIDGDACIGCNACVVACQSENSIPVVGKAEVAVGREMHWLRIDRYYSDLKGGHGLDDPDTHFQPVPCMHCENAPCEVGCPVEATLHDHEGLNLMVYNRCVGTRACSGYCPYKVRHFNYLDYSEVAPAVQLQRNPEVTVRAKGVMEKCTYCVQRIATARITSDKSGQPIPDGAVQTACQGACPTRAISFGDLNDAGSAVAAARHDARNYPLLGELNLKPRTTYLAERKPPVTEGG